MKPFLFVDEAVQYSTRGMQWIHEKVDRDRYKYEIFIPNIKSEPTLFGLEKMRGKFQVNSVNGTIHSKFIFFTPK